MPTLLIVVSGSIIALLGLGHLILTYRGPKLLPRDRDLVQRMQDVHLVITTQTTLWRAWIGFNVSHSLGAMLFGFVYTYLAVAYPEVLFASVPLQLCGLVLLVWFLVLARLYWFSSPLIGIGLSLLCYICGMALNWL